MVNGRVLPRSAPRACRRCSTRSRALVREAAPGSPVYIRMADEFLNDLAKLTAADLDALAPNNPLMLCLTTDSVVNTRMLERAFAAGLPRDHFGVVKDASGKPTGSCSPPRAAWSGGTCATGPS